LRSDGGARGNPGPAAAAFVLETEDGEPICCAGRYLGETTNNVAEYEALIWGLDHALSAGIELSVAYCDSELLVKQVSGEYRVKHPNMRPLHQRVVALLARHGGVEVVHVPRSENTAADSLVNEALDARGSVGDPCATGPAAEQGTLFE
jgi:ribonuclease HI